MQSSNMSRGQMTDLVSQLNQGYMGSVVESGEINPFTEDILQHARVSESIHRQEHYIRRQAGLIEEDDEPYYVETVADIRSMPDSMKIPVLADYRVRPYLQHKRIVGWDIPHETLERTIGPMILPVMEDDAPVSFNTTEVDDDLFDMYVEHAANKLNIELQKRVDTRLKDPSDPLSLHPIYDEIR